MKRISVLDLLLCILLVLGLVGAAWRFQSAQPTPATDGAVITLVQKKVHSDTVCSLGVGDALFDGAGNLWGHIDAITSRPSRILLEENGRFYEGEWEGEEWCDVQLTVGMTGKWRTGVFLQNGRTPVSVGSRCILYTSRATLQLTVTKVLFAHEKAL